MIYTAYIATHIHTCGCSEYDPWTCIPSSTRWRRWQWTKNCFCGRSRVDYAGIWL